MEPNLHLFLTHSSKFSAIYFSGGPMIRRVVRQFLPCFWRLKQRTTTSAPARLSSLIVLTAALSAVTAVAVRADAPIATVGLTPGWVTFGQAVPQGMASAGLKIGSLDTQTDVKTTWSDGSIRFAVLTANVLAAGNYAVTAAPSVGGPLTPSLPTASVALNIGGVVFTANLPAALSSDRWLSGPLVYEGRDVVAPISAADSSAHPFLRVIFDTRVYMSGDGRVDVTVENVLNKVGATTVTYDVAITVNSTQFSQSGVEHFYLTRWRKVFDVGPGMRGVVTPDMTPFNVSRALPKYLSLVGTQVDNPTGPTYGILQPGTLDPNMPAHGGNPDLAPFPDWTARYLVHKDPGQRQFVLANGDLAGSWPVHVREPEPGVGTYSGVGPERLISLNQRPLLWYDARARTDFMDAGVTLTDGTVTGNATTPLDYIKGTPLPIREYGSTVPGPGQSPLIPDNAHQPSLAYVPYLLTGDRYYGEEMAFWANYGILRTRPADGVRGVGGILANNEVRGYGWALRNIADAAAFYPGAAVNQYLSQKVQANLQFLDANANSQDSVINPFKILWIGYRPEPGFISLWEQTYLAYAIDRANKQGFVGGLAHRNAIALLQLRLFTSPDYPREAPVGTSWSAPYLLGVGTVPVSSSWTGFAYYKTMAEIFSATSNVATAAVCFNNTLGVQVPSCLQRDFAGFYGPEARLNLMMLIDSGKTEAQEPYDYLMPFLSTTNSYCAIAYGGTGNADRPDLTCRSGWALDFYPNTTVPGTNTAPTFTPPADITAIATSALGATVSFTAVGNDAEQGPLPAICTPASGSPFTFGTTVVNCTVTDAGGLSTSGSFKVTVLDAAPVFTAPGNITTTAPSAVGAIVTYTTPTATDFKDGTVAVTCSPASGSTFGVTTTTVSCEATNSSNMKTTHTFTVTVLSVPGSLELLSKFVVFSNDMTWLRAQTTVVTGDVGPNLRREHWHHDDDGDADDVTVWIGEQVTLQQPGSRVVGDTVRLGSRSSVFDIIDNFLIKSRKATILGTLTKPMAIPFLTLPASPVVTPGTAKVEVARGATKTLAPGAYGKVHVSNKGTLILTGGLYQMLSLDVDQSATVMFQAATDVQIKTGLDTDNKAKIIPDPAVTGLKASSLMIFVGGTDDNCEHDGWDSEANEWGGEAVAHIGVDNVLEANIYAPRGTIWIKSRTQATGAFVGDDVRIGQNVKLTLDSAFK